jgi:hypothetical protein
MKKMNEKEYLEQRLEGQINWYDQESMFNQKFFKRLRATEMFLTILITFLVGHIPKYHGLVFVVGILSVLVAFIAGILSLGKYYEYWVEYRSMCETLKQEKYLYLTKAGPYATEKPLAVLVERAEKIISYEQANWQQLYRFSNKPLQD